MTVYIFLANLLAHAGTVRVTDLTRLTPAASVMRAPIARWARDASRFRGFTGALISLKGKLYSIKIKARAA